MFLPASFDRLKEDSSIIWLTDLKTEWPSLSSCLNHKCIPAILSRTWCALHNHFVNGNKDLGPIYVYINLQRPEAKIRAWKQMKVSNLVQFFKTLFDRLFTMDCVHRHLKLLPGILFKGFWQLGFFCGGLINQRPQLARRDTNLSWGK